MTSLHRGLRRIVRSVLGSGNGSPIARLAADDPRWPTFKNAVDYINFDRVPGDIVECGVFSGVSLALLAHLQRWHDRATPRHIVGFDSFDGLPHTSDEHELWKEGSFAVNPWDHPTIAVGARVTPAAIHELFAICGLPRPALEVGLFASTLPTSIPARYSSIALLHIDCDLYESTRDVFSGVSAALQDGTVILFDDWFLYRGNPRRGEARAFTEFLGAHPEWQAVQYRDYGTCGKAFILSRR